MPFLLVQNQFTALPLVAALRHKAGTMQGSMVPKCPECMLRPRC